MNSKLATRDKGTMSPEGWSTVSLQDLVEFALGGEWGEAPSLQLVPQTVHVNVIRGTEFRRWAKEKGRTAAVRQISTGSLLKRQLREGDIVTEISGGGPDQPVGRTLVIDKAALEQSTNPLVCSNFCRQLRLHPNVDSRFVNFSLIHQYKKGRFNIFQTETTNIRNLNFSQFLAETKIPLPPTAEQKRISSQIAVLLAQVSRTNDHLFRVAGIMKRFRQAVLAAACSGRLTADWREDHHNVTASEELFIRAQQLRAERYERDRQAALEQGRRQPSDPRKSARSNKQVVELPDFPPEWKICPLQDLSYLITDGTHKTPTYRDDGIPFLSVKNVRPFRVLTTDVKRISTKEHRDINHRCNPEIGDILYTKVGATFGYAAVNHLAYPFSLFVSVALIKIVHDCFTPEYAEIVMNSNVVYRQAKDRVSGSGTPDLHLIEIRDFRIPLPSLGEQKEIVRRANQLFQLTSSMEGQLSTAREKADKLTQSILAKAFRGELVPTEAELARREDREYEPASVLLERIKKERASETKPSRMKRGVRKASA